MPRIAFVLTQDSGGPVDVTVRLARTLLDRGDAEVRVFGPPPARGAELLDGVLEPIVVDRKGNLAGARMVRRGLRAWHADVVHAQDRRSGLVVAGLSSRGGPHVVHTYHGVPDDVTDSWFRGTAGSSPPSRYTRTVLTADALVARAVDRTVVPAAAMSSFLRRRLRVPANRLVHIDNGVALPPAAPPRAGVRRLLFVGLLVERKGLLDLLDALARPGVMPDDASLTVAGDGPARAGAEALASAPTLAGRVEFLGFRTDVESLLAHHDALVLPSRMEQQPLVVAEAMGAGKPVLATDTGGVAEMLDTDGAHRYLVPPNDVDALSRSLRELFDDPEPGALGAQLARRARERYAADVCAEAHLRLYASLAG